LRPCGGAGDDVNYTQLVDLFLMGGKWTVRKCTLGVPNILPGAAGRSLEKAVKAIKDPRKSSKNIV
jgi:hypothetical protein